MSNTNLLGAYGGLGNSGLQFRNKIINGDFGVWQRGTSTSSTVTDIFQADRWKTTVDGANVNYTYARSTDIPNLASTYSARVTQTTGQNASSLTEYALRQVIEKQSTLGLVGKPITVSFWYKSNVTGTHGVRVIGNASGYTGGADQSQSFTVNAANTWEYKTLTFTAVQGVTAVTGDMSGIGMYLDIGPRVYQVGQTSFAGDAYFSIAQVQMEAGPVATPFEHRPYGLELSLCQRYCYVLVGTDGIEPNSNYAKMGLAFARLTTAADVLVMLPTMRSFPTFVDAGSGIVQLIGSASYGGVNQAFACTGSGLESGSITSRFCIVRYIVGGGGLVVGQTYLVEQNNTKTKLQYFTAEL